MAWFQKEITISAKKRGCHLISDEFLSKVPEIKSIKVGIAHVFSMYGAENLLSPNIIGFRDNKLLSSCPFDISRKDFFCWAFFFK